MNPSQSEAIVGLIGALARDDEATAVALIGEARDDAVAPLLRTAGFHASRTPFFYRRLLNQWRERGRIPLKPSPRSLSVELLSDGTVQGLSPYLELFTALYGFDTVITLADYDSVEHVALSASEPAAFDISIVLLSDHWLQRHVGAGLADRKQVANVKRHLEDLVGGLQRKRLGQILLTTFVNGPWPMPGACVCTPTKIGHQLAVAEINTHLATCTTPRVHLLDWATAVQLAGGGDSIGRLAYLRAHSPMEERGFVALAREAAAGISALFGRSHRALLTDWDNTLWGGEVGEVGVHDVVCGPDSPDALGFFLLQQYMRELTLTGVLLAGISRNGEEAAKIWDENTNLGLRRKDFASLALSWGNKSDSVVRIADELNFGIDLMLYIDDNAVDLAEVLGRHPTIDVVQAGPSPDLSLARLCAGRYFSTLHVTEDDIARGQRAAALASQKNQLPQAADPSEFLASLRMQLHVETLKQKNTARVLQLLQKTNQFNLTTKRHGEQDLASLQQDAAEFGVFTYLDKFGTQGIIGLVILVPRGDAMMVDTWLMSCRVLNRGVENAMFDWMRRQADGRAIIGQYIATEKNRLVQDLYSRLGFDRCADESGVIYTFGQKSSIKLSCRHELDLIYE